MDSKTGLASVFAGFARGTRTHDDSDGHNSDGHNRSSPLLLEPRISVIITGAFSIAAALLVMASMLYDAYKVKNNSQYSKNRKFLLVFPLVHRAEVFPFIISLAVLVQGSIFIGVESSGLNSVKAVGCRRTAELVWPTIWLVAVTTLIFGLETTFRSLRRKGFRPFGSWNIPICIALVNTFMVLLWLSAYLVPAADICEAGSLTMWIVPYAEWGIVIASGIILTSLICGLVIVSKLRRTIVMEKSERIGATRVVWSLGISVIILAFVLPFCVRNLHTDGDVTSQIASIALNLSGIFYAAVHLFLRANSSRMAIRPKAAPWAENRSIRLFGPNDLYISRGTSSPIYPEKPDDVGKYLARTPSPNSGLNSPEPFRAMADSENTCVQYATSPQRDVKMSQPIPLAQPPKQTTRQFRRPSHYSIFPQPSPPGPVPTSGPKSSPFSGPSARPVSWETRYDGDVIPLPPPLFAPRHRRDDSDESSATVQIGLRLSHAVQDRSPSTASTTSTAFLDVPLQMRGPLSPLSKANTAEGNTILPSRPMRARQSVKSNWSFKRDSFSTAHSPQTPRTPKTPRTPRRESLMKSLPPVPKIPNWRESTSPRHVNPPLVTQKIPERTTRLQDRWI